MNKFEPYFNRLVSIVICVVIWLLYGALMYGGMCLTEGYLYLQVSFGALWFCGFLLTSLAIAVEIGEIQRIRKLGKR